MANLDGAAVSFFTALICIEQTGPKKLGGHHDPDERGTLRHEPGNGREHDEVYRNQALSRHALENR